MEKVNSLKGNKEQSVSGWTFDLNNGPWNDAPWDYCSVAPWFGWKSNDKVGSIKTTLYGIGYASLTFGNCWTTGTVNLYLDGAIIDSAGPGSMKTAIFDYSNGNELKLDETNEGIIMFEDFKISNCEGKQIIYTGCPIWMGMISKLNFIDTLYIFELSMTFLLIKHAYKRKK